MNMGNERAEKKRGEGAIVIKRGSGEKGKEREEKWGEKQERIFSPPPQSTDSYCPVILDSLLPHRTIHALSRYHKKISS